MKLKFLFLPLVLGALAVCNGCMLFVVGGAAAAGAGGVAYADGVLKDSEAATLDQSRTATLAAFKDLQYGVVGQSSSPGTYVITARSNTDKKIEVTLVQSSATVTEIRILVDIFGDETLSRQVLAKIKAHL